MIYLQENRTGPDVSTISNLGKENEDQTLSEGHKQLGFTS